MVHARVVVALLAALTVGTGVAGGAAPQPAQGAQPKASENILGDLNSVSAISPTDAWAAGQVFQRGHSSTVAEHWDGTTWSLVSSPSPLDSSFAGVSAVSASDVWAVGGYFPDSGDDEYSLIAHWDGTRWTRVRSMHNTSSDLAAVSGDSASDAWAVGSIHGGETVTEHWNGHRWRRVPSPDLGVLNRLTGVSALSPDDAWAVGDYYADDAQHPFALHWDGATWTVSPMPDFDYALVDGVSALSSDDVWAVGRDESSTARALVLHWDGTTWRVVASPAPGFQSELESVSAESPTDVWATGYSIIRSGGTSADFHTRPLIEHWDGDTWTKVQSPPAAGVQAVSADSPSDAWAVGSETQHKQSITVTLRWDGTRWTRS